MAGHCFQSGFEKQMLILHLGQKGTFFSFTLLVRMCSYLCFEKGLKFRAS